MPADLEKGGITRRGFVGAAARASVGAAVLTLALGRSSRPALASAGRPERVKTLIEDKVHWSREHFSRGHSQAVAVEQLAQGGRLRGRQGGEYVSDVVTASFDATHVGVHWIVSSAKQADLTVSVRTSSAGQGWSSWQALAVEDIRPRGGGRVEVFAALVGRDRGRQAQYRLQFASDNVTVEQVAVTSINSVDGPREAVLDSAVIAKTITTLDGKSLTLITREGWGCDESLRFSGSTEIWPEMYVPAKKIVVHHTAGGNGYADGAAEVRAAYAYQAVTRNFGDIGYHVLVDKFGRLYEGRHGRGEGAGREVLSADLVGGHVYNLNYGSVGVSAVGNYELARPTPELLVSLQDILTYVCGRHGIQPLAKTSFLQSDDEWRDALSSISGHYESWQTACPGSYLISQMSALRNAVASRLGTSSPPTLGERVTPDLVTPGALEFSLPTGTKDYCLEGWRKPAGSEDIVYLRGYTSAGIADDPLAMKMSWVEDSTSTSVRYDNLPAGHYTMHLRTADRRYEASRTYLISDYRAEYFTNTTLSGTPALIRAEAAPICYDWGSSGPGSGVPVDRFSARWQGTFPFEAGTYTFVATADDGVRVWVDGRLVMNEWRDQGPTTYRADVPMTAGVHQVKVEYYENGGGAVAKVDWHLKPSIGQYWAEYFNNLTLSGVPSFAQPEPAPISYNWGSGCPNNVSIDRFSARWVGDFAFDAGPYAFIARADDGVRLWVDGEMLIDQWKDQAPTEYRAAKTVTTGVHQVRVEYYERTGGALIKVWWEKESVARVERIVDDTSGGFTRTGSHWLQANTGYGGHLWWTYNHTTTVDCRGEWRADLQGGSYEVYVWVPYYYTTTRSARYTVCHQAGQTVRTVDQNAYADQWVSLGTYSFAAGITPQVRLTEVTGEPTSTKLIAFDAAKFVPR